MEAFDAGVAGMSPHVDGAIRTAACRGSAACEGRTVTRIGWGSQSGDVSSNAGNRSYGLTVKDQPTVGRSSGGLYLGGRHG